jgi:hypothetical protein
LPARNPEKACSVFSKIQLQIVKPELKKPEKNQKLEKIRN